MNSSNSVRISNRSWKRYHGQRGRGRPVAGPARIGPGGPVGRGESSGDVAEGPWHNESLTGFPDHQIGGRKPLVSKFIALNSMTDKDGNKKGHEVYHINPDHIAYMMTTPATGNRVTVYMADGHRIDPDEGFKEILAKIKKAAAPGG
jgi:hypothetical protein